jgi:4'-phosphopantetheinyl transferase
MWTFPSLPGNGEVHVWRIDLCPARSGGESPDPGILSEEEHARMAKYVQRQDRDRYLARRYWIRRILGCYLRAPPRSLRIRQDAAGRPYFGGLDPAAGGYRDDREGGRDIELSISHSGDAALLAVATSWPVGIDIEFLDPALDPEALLRFSCSPREQDCFREVPGPERRSWFLRAWTAKEACLKLSGTGLAVDPRSIECRPIEDGSFLVEWRGNYHPPEPCKVVPVPAGSGFIASLAVPLTFRSFRLFPGGSGDDAITGK